MNVVTRSVSPAARFIEQLASTLADLGFPRMPARVFAALLASDSGRATAAELTDRLGASPAAISGAVRYLTQLALIARERVPGSRRDHYVLFDDVWYKATLTKDRRMVHLADRLRDGITVLGPDTPAGHRLTETLAFFDFMQRELDLLLARWETGRNGPAGTAPGAARATATPAPGPEDGRGEPGGDAPGEAEDGVRDGNGDADAPGEAEDGVRNALRTRERLG
jgi:DNA-binding transcriptional regulator GbsR (MarR family)